MEMGTTHRAIKQTKSNEREFYIILYIWCAATESSLAADCMILDDSGFVVERFGYLT